MLRSVTVLLLAAGLSGCVSELLEDEQVTVRTFSCAVLGSDRPVWLELHRERGVQRVPLEAMQELARFMEAAGFGPEGRFQARESSLLQGDVVWSLEELRLWSEDQAILAGDVVRLHVVWIEAFVDEGPTAVMVAPGVVVISEAAVVAGAERLERSEDFLARTLLWHAVGHSFGAVNQGIPLNGTDPAAQEGPPGHEPDPQSVLYAGWDRVSTMPRTNQTMPGFSAAVVDDWRTAVAPGGVCA